MKKTAIVLLSGGIDSAVTLYAARKKGYKILALIFDYGQRHRREIGFAKKIATRAGSSYRVVKVALPRKGTSLVDRKMKLPTGRSPAKIKKSVPSTYVPGRNLIFLSMAAAFAESEKAKAIFIGAHTEDYSGYPDCKKPFFNAFKKTINVGTKSGKGTRIHAPLIGKDKKQIIKTGLRLRVPFEITWSCYEGKKVPCGTCDSCIFRNRAFKALKIEDPYYERG